MKNAIIFVIALAISSLALAESPAQNYGKYAAPFGLEWGMSKEQVMEMGVELTPSDSVKGNYGTTTLPKNLSDAKEYDLFFEQEFGLVLVAAYTRHMTGDLYGSKGKERYSQLKTAIIKKYGKPRLEYEMTGLTRIFGDSNQFYECLKYDGCGAWTSFWGSAKDGNIRLDILGLSRGTGWVSLIYASAASFTASEKKKEEQSRSDEDAL